MCLFKPRISPQTLQDLGSYLAGLIEGDGHFSKNQLIISCHNRDDACFRSLIKRIGYGTLKPYSKGRALRLVVSSKVGLRRILELVNGKFVGYNKYNQLVKHNYAGRLNVKIIPPQPFTLDCFWLSGFIDADGCFNISVRKCPTSRLGIRIDLRLAVAQKERFLLDQIQNAFNAFRIYVSKKSSNPHFRLTILGYKRLPGILDYFDKYPLQTLKNIHYRIFRRCFRFMELKKHLRMKGIKQIKAWQQILVDTYK